MSRGAHGHPDWSPIVPTDTPLDENGRVVWSREQYQVALAELRSQFAASTMMTIPDDDEDDLSADLERRVQCGAITLDEARMMVDTVGSATKRKRDAPRTYDNEIAKWVDEIRRERHDLTRRGYDPPVSMQINRVPFEIRAGLMAALRGDGIMSMRDETGMGRPCTVLTFRPPATANDDPPVDHDPDEPAVVTAARRLRVAQATERAVREESRMYELNLYDYRRTAVHSQMRRVVCCSIIAVIVQGVALGVGMPSWVAILLAIAAVAVGDHTGGRPMIKTRRELHPHPGDWSALCQRYEDAVLELYAAEIVDGIARMEAAAAERDEQDRLEAARVQIAAAERDALEVAGDE